MKVNEYFSHANFEEGSIHTIFILSGNKFFKGIQRPEIRWFLVVHHSHPKSVSTDYETLSLFPPSLSLPFSHHHLFLSLLSQILDYCNVTSTTPVYLTVPLWQPLRRASGSFTESFFSSSSSSFFFLPLTILYFSLKTGRKIKRPG